MVRKLCNFYAIRNFFILRRFHRGGSVTEGATLCFIIESSHKDSCKPTSCLNVASWKINSFSSSNISFTIEALCIFLFGGEGAFCPIVFVMFCLHGTLAISFKSLFVLIYLLMLNVVHVKKIVLDVINLFCTSAL